MMVSCDHCGGRCDSERALVLEGEDRELFYFCGHDCFVGGIDPALVVPPDDEGAARLRKPAARHLLTRPTPPGA